MLIVESTLLTWSTLFDLFFAFEYFYKTQENIAIGDDLSYGLNTLGPLCLWQCLWFSAELHKILSFARLFARIFAKKATVFLQK